MKKSVQRSWLKMAVGLTIALPLGMLTDLCLVNSARAEGTIGIGQADPASGGAKVAGEEYHASVVQADYDINEVGRVPGKGEAFRRFQSQKADGRLIGRYSA